MYLIKATPWLNLKQEIGERSTMFAGMQFPHVVRYHKYKRKTVALSSPPTVEKQKYLRCASGGQVCWLRKPQSLTPPGTTPVGWSPQARRQVDGGQERGDGSERSDWVSFKGIQGIRLLMSPNY